MPGQQMSDPNPSNSVPLVADTLREPFDYANFEADLAGLAARFAQESGGGLTRELSAELALEIVLNEIVEQACRTTGATGSAIVLERDGEMICRASSGSTAPELGSRLEILSGLSGECLRTRRTQWSDDAWADPRADVGASERLGVRSVVVMPLLRENRLVGIFELFSTQPYAFGVRDERILEALAERTLNSLDSAVRALETEPEPPPSVAPVLQMDAPDLKELLAPSFNEEKASSGEASEPAPRPSKTARLDPLTWALGAALLATAVLMGVVLGRHLQLTRNPKLQVEAATTEPKKVGLDENRPVTNAGPKSAASAKINQSVATPPGGLLVFKGDKEVFRMPASKVSDGNLSQAAGMQPASDVEQESVLQVPQDSAEKELVRRVEPQYPDAAREQNIQGEVVLEVHIGADGAVQDIQVVSGHPLLTKASSDAVRQWKFKTKIVNGKPVETQTRITLNFRLPAQALLTSPN